MGTLEYCWPSTRARLPVEHYLGQENEGHALRPRSQSGPNQWQARPRRGAQGLLWRRPRCHRPASPHQQCLYRRAAAWQGRLSESRHPRHLLLGSSDESSDEAEYGAPAVDSYGAPAQEYAEPAPSYDAPAPAYEEPAPSYDAPAPAYDAP